MKYKVQRIVTLQFYIRFPAETVVIRTTLICYCTRNNGTFVMCLPCLPSAESLRHNIMTTHWTMRSLYLAVRTSRALPAVSRVSAAVVVPCIKHFKHFTMPIKSVKSFHASEHVRMELRFDVSEIVSVSIIRVGQNCPSSCVIEKPVRSIYNTLQRAAGCRLSGSGLTGVYQVYTN
jgi:hypothetical protein